MMKKGEQKIKKGLYTPQLEKDSCGVGIYANIDNIPNHKILANALTMLENMEHRGACGCEESTGDGAGVLTQIPDELFRKESAITLPPKGKYGVGVFFLPKEKQAQANCLTIIEAQSIALDFELIYQRTVVTNNQEIGESALSTEPDIVQIFFKQKELNLDDLEQQFYFLRSLILKQVHETYPQLVDDFYIASLSSKTIVYKGMLKATQLRHYYEDLQNPHFKTAVAMVHSRFSTNTFPKWKLAQPFHCIAHNGEINTLQGNLNWWKTREKYIKHVEHIAQDQPDLSKLFPICDTHISDSGNFDNAVNFLLQTNRSIPHTMMMMVPEAWQNDEAMPADKKAFYQYHDSIMEAWDGPASICFTDGTIIGATLDRNGLRPSRYVVTKDNHLIIASEAGCIEIAPELIAKKGKLKPGKLLVADLEKKCIISDEAVKNKICTQKPYATWIQNHTLNLKNLATQKVDFPLSMPLLQKQISVGFGKEDSKLIVAAMLKNGKEAIGSMGSDIPLAILSKKHQHLSHYFKQQFAQVTNPPIDPLREQYYMSLTTAIGAKSKIIDIGAEQANVIQCTSPIITEQQLANLLNTQKSDFDACTLYSTFTEKETMIAALDALCQTAFTQIKKGKRIICVSDRTANKDNIAIPSLLSVSTLHHFLIDKGLRKEVTLMVDASDVWETHHVASLLSYGADLICPYLSYKSIEYLSEIHEVSQENALANYIKALEKGLLKIMSKLGISTLSSYKGAQTFEALGISQEVVNHSFKGTISRIGGLDFDGIQKETTLKHLVAFDQKTPHLTNDGIYSWRKTGEYHLFNPTTIHLLQHASKSNQYDVYQKFAKAIDNLEVNSSTLRSHLRIKKGKSIPIEEVESVENILKRFATGAMSFGSISWEAHTTLAIAMNRIGAKSNSGEGGEDASRYTPLPNGDQQHSAIKQVASGRFGVNIHYLSNAAELQIKIAQGAKPGEGGQLPGHKVNEHIAKVRNATPNVGLISPPPHHDIYSIEDLAQLIFDLKNANRAARISVKLVSKTGIGVIATGVTKAHADHILISGYDGGTGASPLSSIRHAGLPWEMGLSETHQTLVKNGLRDRVVLQADGQIRTGRDLAVATMLGAEEWGIATAALVIEGCILMRKCHLNTCPVGIATQDKTLREKFEGKVEHLVNYFRFLAQHLREIMASVGVKTVNELVGRTDLLEIQNQDHYKSKNLQLAALLHQEHHPNNKTLYGSIPQNHGLESVLDQKLLQRSLEAIDNETMLEATFPIKNTDRAVGTLLSNEITKRYGAKGLKTGSLQFTFKGSAGQSFGAFGTKGLLFNVEGEANDYFGKGLSGATLSVRPDKQACYEPHKNVIVGNVALYGATAGKAFINGIAGDRFCVRNSGAQVVVEGLGDNGCEYMTGGKVVVLGEIGRNFGAGMSGGIAYLYDTSPLTHSFINQEMVYLETPTKDNLNDIYHLLRKHAYHTQSPLAANILGNWALETQRFLKIYPMEYKRAVEQKLKVANSMIRSERSAASS